MSAELPEHGIEEARTPTLFVAVLLPPLERRGLDVDRALAGILPRQALREVTGSIPIEQTIELLDRVVMQLGGMPPIEAAIRELFSSPTLERLKVLAGLASPRALFAGARRLIIRPLAGSALRAEFIDDDHFQVDLKPYRDGPMPHYLVRCWVAVLQSLPSLIGVADAMVEVRTEGSIVSLVATIPRRPSVGLRMLMRLRALFRANALLDQLAEQQDLLVASFDQLREVNDQLQRRAQEMRASQTRYEAVVENIGDLIVVCDEKGRTVFANRGAREIFGVDSVRRSATIFQHVHPEDLERAQRVFQHSLMADRAQRAEFRLRHPATQAVTWIEASGQRLPSADGRATLLISGRDISARKHAELARQQAADRLEIEVRRRTHELERANQETRELHTRLIDAERMGAAQKLAGSVAHAINNPLTALAGTVEMMLESEPNPDPILERVLQLAHRIRAVVGRTLQLSREGTMNFAREDPGEILKEVHDEIQGRCVERGVSLELKIEPQLPQAYADRTLLRAALVGIAENAVEASPEGGTLSLQASAIAGLRIVEFRVEDQGPGIPESLRHRVFEPFFTTKVAGTGLGLAISRGIVLGHDGRIRFTDRPGGGTIATIEIPLQVDDARGAAGGARPAAAPAGATRSPAGA